jgi:hypothetical protein
MLFVNRLYFIILVINVFTIVIMIIYFIIIKVETQVLNINHRPFHQKIL